MQRTARIALIAVAVVVLAAGCDRVAGHGGASPNVAPSTTTTTGSAIPTGAAPMPATTQVPPDASSGEAVATLPHPVGGSEPTPVLEATPEAATAAPIEIETEIDLSELNQLLAELDFDMSQMNRAMNQNEGDVTP